MAGFEVITEAETDQTGQRIADTLSGITVLDDDVETLSPSVTIGFFV